MRGSRLVGLWICGLITSGLGGCATDPNLERVRAFRTAREAGDLETARSFLTDDPRVWYERREGEGRAFKLDGTGLYGEWDREFRSEGEVIRWEHGPGYVAAIHSEMNDYFRLIERNGSWYRQTWFFDDDGKTEGTMISAWEGAPEKVDRFDEFEAWAAEHYPEEWAYLRPGGRLDPTGDRAARTRRLLVEWRSAVGLPQLD